VDKKAIERFAVNARKELIEQVKQKAFEIGILGDSKITELTEVDGQPVLNGTPKDSVFQKQRDRLVREVKIKGYEQVMEEAAYTWFNRFIALRFMEVNGYLPTGVRVLSSTDPSRNEPDIIRQALTVDLDVDENIIYEYQDANDTEGLFKYLILNQCNALHDILPFMFEPIDDYTELLFPNGLLSEGSVIRDMVESIKEEDWREVEIIGWMYQYYISEKHRKIVGMNKGKVSKEDLPAATQLFTPEWIVKYLVQNSLGKMWHDAHPGTQLPENWEYYLVSRPVADEPQVVENVDIESIKILDPACGSGHILVYAFDLLFEIYQSLGYLAQDIPALILENNLYGMDICGRAAQLAAFALMMKARERNPHLFSDSAIVPNIVEIRDSEPLSDGAIKLCCDGEQEEEEIRNLVQECDNAKQFGSLLTVTPADFRKYIDRIESLRNESSGDLVREMFVEELSEKLLPVLEQAALLTDRCEVVVTNPPYHNKYNPTLKKFMHKEYKDYKQDLYSAFIYRCAEWTVKNGYAGLMSPFTWMFISTHEKLRRYVIETKGISSLVQLEYSGFAGATVPVCTFVIQNQNVNSVGQYVRLSDFPGPSMQPVKTSEAAANSGVSYRYTFDSKDFADLPGAPIAYWASDQVRKVFRDNPPLGDFAELKVGLQTSDNKRFLRLWHEVDINRIGFGFPDAESAKESGLRWFPYNKGGPFRKWYGNQDYVVNWESDGAEIKNFDRAVVRNPSYYFHEGITWSNISSSKFSARLLDSGFIPGHKGPTCYAGAVNLSLSALGLLNSKVTSALLRVLSATISFEVGQISLVPAVRPPAGYDRIQKRCMQNVVLSRSDWDSFETSWHFQQHPLLKHRQDATTLSEAMTSWSKEAEDRFKQLKANEEELNRIFIDIYGLQDELSPEVDEEDVTVRKADRERDIKSFISYAVGCMLGRYSLDEEGLMFAGGDFNPDRYKTFPVSTDGILPVPKEEYFEQDIVTRFIDFLEVTFGEDSLQENLEYIAETLGRRSRETVRDCIRRYFIRDFYKDHLQTYSKRPVYWMFSSGRRRAFNAFIYMHRYNPDTVARVRVDYLHELQDRMEAERMRLVRLVSSDAEQMQKTKARKRMDELDKDLEELRAYDEKIHHLADQQIEIDLDDGVVENYARFDDVLARI